MTDGNQKCLRNCSALLGARGRRWDRGLLVVLIVGAVGSASAQTTSKWLDAVDGDWGDPTKWSTTAFPNNGSPTPADTYDAVIDATGGPYTVDLHTAVTLDSLLLNSADATLRLAKYGDLSVLGPFELQAGSLALSGGTITGGTITNTGGSPVWITGGTLDGVTLDADAEIHGDGTRTLFVRNGLTLVGRTIELATGDSGRGRHEIEFVDPNGLLDGQGVIRFTGRGSFSPMGIHPRVAASAGTLTIGPDILVEALASRGQLGSGQGGLINNGVIRVGGSLTIAGQDWINNGRIEIESSAGLDIGGTVKTPDLGTIINNGGSVILSGTIDNTGQALDLKTTFGRFRMESGGTVKGGSLTGTPPLELDLSSTAPPYLDGVALNIDLLLTAPYPLGIKNGLTLNNRKIKLTTGAGLLFAGSQTLGGTGELIVNSRPASGGCTTTLGGSGLVIGPDITIRTGYDAGGSFDIEIWGGGLVNQGTIVVDKGAVTLGGSGWSNQGLIEHSGGSLHFGGSYTTAAIGNLVHTGGDLTLGGTMDNTGNTLLLDASTGSWDLRGTIVGGTIETADGAQLVVKPYQQADLEGVTLAGEVTCDDNSRLRIMNGCALDGGVIRMLGVGESSDYGFHADTISGHGEIVFDGPGEKNVIYASGDQGLTIGEGVTVRTGTGSGSIGSGYHREQPLTNRGTISAETPGQEIHVIATLANSGTLQASGGTLKITSPDWTNQGAIKLHSATISLSTGSLEPALSLTNGTSGRIEGIGTLDGSETTFINHGSVDPGIFYLYPSLYQPGRLTFDGEYHQAEGGVLSIDIGRWLAADRVDSVGVTGGAWLGGRLEVQVLPEARLSYGDTLEFLTAASVTGRFDEQILPTWPDGEPMFRVRYGADRVALVCVPEPGGLALVAVGLGLLLGCVGLRKSRS